MAATSLPNRAGVLGRLDRAIERIEATILSTAILLMAANTIANVIGRYLLDQSIYFSEELNEFLIVLITFVGLGYATRKGIHIRMSALHDALPDPAKRVLLLVVSAVTAAVLAVLAWHAFEYVQKLASRGRVTPALQVPLYLTYIWVVVGLALACLQYVLACARNFGRGDGKPYLSYWVEDNYEDPEIQAALARQRESDI